MAGQNRPGTTGIPERSPGFRKAPVPDPLSKNRNLLQSGKPNHHPTRTNEEQTASLCPAMRGMRPLGPSQPPARAANIADDGRLVEITHSIGRRVILSVLNGKHDLAQLGVGGI